MDVSEAIIATAGPGLLASKARHIRLAEYHKGCRPDISASPVALEPAYHPLTGIRELFAATTTPHEVLEPPVDPSDLRRMQIWVSPDQAADWYRSERLLKQLSLTSHRLAFEIAGNSNSVYLSVLLHRADLPILEAAFRGEFTHCELAPLPGDLIRDIPAEAWDDAVFYDYYPWPSYANSLTCMDELRTTPYEPLVATLSTITPPALGVYQVVFQPVSPGHDWHHNVRVLQDLEYLVKQADPIQLSQRFAQQPPSGSLHQMAQQLQQKAHNDKPFYAVSLRLAVVGAGANGNSLLLAAATLCTLFQHGGRRLRCLTEQAYKEVLGRDAIGRMFADGLTHRPGFLANSWELTSLAHIPPSDIAEARRLPLAAIRSLPPIGTALTVGTPVGESGLPGQSRLVCIPDVARMAHLHLVGRPGSGKSTVIEHMVLHDIQQGHGVALFDPHGDLTDRILRLIPEKEVPRIIHFRPGDPDYVPLWNPMVVVPGQDLPHTASNLVRAFKSYVSGWGHRLEHLLRYAILALLHRPGSTLLDVSNLLQIKSAAHKQLGRELLSLVRDEAVKRFLEVDLESYKPADLAPAQHKLGQLLFGGSVSLMLRQPRCSFNLRRIMDEAMVLLVDLSGIDTERRNTLGSLMLALMHSAALARRDLRPEDRRPFHLHCDEAHRFITDALEDFIVETRKFAVSLALAHQHLSQFPHEMIGALTSTNSALYFSVNTHDAATLAKDLRHRADAKDLATLDKYEAMFRCDTEVVRVRTLPPLVAPASHFRDRIIAESRQRYYCPTAEVTGTISSPTAGDWTTSSLTDPGLSELIYDEGL